MGIYITESRSELEELGEGEVTIGSKVPEEDKRGQAAENLGKFCVKQIS